MGGRKKTKWRKLPLEFTKDCSRRSSEEIKSDRKEENSYPENAEAQSFANEYSDGAWYPTHYLVYNPIEVPVYHPNYMMPTDTNCYYYPPNEMNTVADYTGVPLQEYIPPMKETVYLLFPASALRPAQYSPYDWRNRRRRRRYNGYAEYAVIPEKSNVEDKPNEKIETPARSIPRQFEKTSSEKIDVPKHTAQKQDNQNTDKKLDDNIGLNNKMGLSKSERNEEPPNRQKKVVDVCDVHSNISKQELKNILNDKNLSKNDCDLPNSSSATDFETNNMIQEHEVSRFESNSNGKCHEPIETEFTDKLIGNEKENPIKSENDACDAAYNSPNNTFSDVQASCKIFDPIEEENEKKDAVNEESTLFSNCNKTSDIICDNAESDQSNFNPSSLPDIISTVNKIITDIDENNVSATLSNNNRTQNFSSIHNTKNINECVSKIPSVSATRSAYLPYLYNTNSDALSSESKIIDNTLPKTHSLYTNNSIYKLAFDESLEDLSDTESRSPSPIVRCPVDKNRVDRGSIDPESQVPSSLMSNEINVYEADSGDDAGSEDLELIPHRYESESFLNKSKHLYENKLSLAVELLRTKESLPYDAQFKRVIEESQESAKTESCRTGEVNMGFVDDFNSLDGIELKSNNLAFNQSDHEAITKQSKIHKQTSPSYDIPLDDSFTNSYELADEAIAQSANHQDNREEVNAGYRRIGVQFRHYFSPTSTLVNSWNCCIIM
ncbi:putative uncharacterized protein DDB_G0282133 isoform X2 [Parasteatoda tepidariorum]|uniref:putative uncharacterized protein DDB_G0282133 isoform X2 n=1 Tax=Parasteatoda tepidariorum TaxID=114398 RepID=UPI001C727816|nr:silent chromatin protein ESC1 isoform X2 [Parasteatoda tepidariorum]